MQDDTSALLSDLSPGQLEKSQSSKDFALQRAGQR